MTKSTKSSEEQLDACKKFIKEIIEIKSPNYPIHRLQFDAVDFYEKFFGVYMGAGRNIDFFPLKGKKDA